MKQATKASDYAKSVKAVRYMRSKTIWEYQDTEKEEQCGRVLDYMVSRSMRHRRNERINLNKGCYSGLTRSDLAASSTCEPDWF